ncbi:Nucleotide-binding universal stress protein, UspA family [Halovenus aranensis]|jgi:nucleotide-binding universal stress UspA family protein|uniref:Nucleotide-binding universal stress protein, UspA family n=1 Tax=Halovenus aranensis TaxID=890420 RepID=A0A1G8XFH9_9EURY|nr:universal stress protein [Halovenus aranensis]SDJ89231.1 Nucleotide-binding universal stress protein, UspA family [Halovenus aranensis]
MYSDVLVPTDGSEAMETVLDHTAEVTGKDGTVHVLYVVDDQVFLTLADEMKDDVLVDLREEGSTAVHDARESAEETGFDVSTAIREGKPADEIIAYVEEAGIDLVTMGTRGDDYTENMLGSTAQKVVTNCPAPVLTVNVEA